MQTVSSEPLHPIEKGDGVGVSRRDRSATATIELEGTLPNLFIKQTKLLSLWLGSKPQVCFLSVLSFGSRCLACCLSRKPLFSKSEEMLFPLLVKASGLLFLLPLEAQRVLKLFLLPLQAQNCKIK